MTTLNLKQQKKAFAKKFKAARVAANLSQVKLAKLTGISNSTLSNYEVAKTLPDAVNMKKLVKVLSALASAPEGKPAHRAAVQAKASLIQDAAVSVESAKAAFMRTLITSAPEMKTRMDTIMEQAKKANISQPEAMSMLSVLLEKQ